MIEEQTTAARGKEPAAAHTLRVNQPERPGATLEVSVVAMRGRADLRR